MNRPLPSSEMSLKLRRSKTEDGLLSSREERCHLLRGKDESRDSAFFSLNNTSLCLSPELKQPEESDQEIESQVYQQHQVANDLPKPLYLEVCFTQSPLHLPFQVPGSPPTVKVKREWVWGRLQESLSNEKSRFLVHNMNLVLKIFCATLKVRELGISSLGPLVGLRGAE